MKILCSPFSALPAHRTTWVPAAKHVFASAALATLLLSGCKSNPPDDATVTRNVQSSLSTDSALNGLGIQASAQGGVVTLSGNVQNDAQRTLAARDASAIAGVRQVVNNVMLTPVAAPPEAAQAVTAAPAAIPAPIRNTPDRISSAERSRQHEIDQRRAAEQQRAEERNRMQNNQPAPIERSSPPAYSSAANSQSAPVQQTPPPPQPVFRDLSVPAGYAIAVRVTQTIDSADAQQGQTFSGVVANNVMVDGLVAIPAGTHVSGTVDAVQEAGHFKGNSLLTVSLSSLSRRGETIPVASEPYTVQGKGRGKNTLEKTGGGAAVGAILGGIFGGGKGAAIGAAAGGGVGAGSNAITRGEQIQIASESIVRFRLTKAVPVRVRADGQTDTPANSDPALQHHNPQ